MNPSVSKICRTATLVLSILAGSQTLQAQNGPDYFHATLRGWEERAWFRILDRNGAAGGRFSEQGILQRFQPNIDGEYQLDLLTHRFSLSEDYEWYARRNGIRWSGGSVDKRELAATTDARITVDLSDTWAIGVRFNQELNPEGDRNLVRLGATKTWSSGLSLTFGGHVDRVKTGMDLIVGGGWQSNTSPVREGFVVLALLDAFNNSFNGLDSAVDSTQAYDVQPLAVRSGITLQAARTVRVQLYATLTRPSTILLFQGTDETAGIRQDESFAYAGGLIEWSPIDVIRVGSFGTYVRAKTERTPLSDGATDAFDLTEVTGQLGFFAMGRIGRSFETELWVGHMWRPETNTFPESTQPDIDYEDRAWIGRALLLYTAPFGLVVETGFAFDNRRVIRGSGSVPARGSLDGHNRRAQLGVGWAIGDQLAFRIAQRFDLDSGAFLGDGGVARISLYW